MKILITGGAGFLGAHLCKHYLDLGCHVTCLDNMSKGNFEVKKLVGDPNFVIDQRDVRMTPWSNVPPEWNEWDNSDSCWYHGNLDAVLHFASYPSPKDHRAWPVKTLEADSKGLMAFIDLALVKRCLFVYASSGHVDTPYDPTDERSVYIEGKRFGEAMIAASEKAYGLKARIVRMFNSYGPGMRPDDGRVVPAFIMKALKGESIEIWGGDQLVSLTYVDDMVKGIETVISSSVTEPVELGDADRIPIYLLARKIIQFTDSNSKLSLVPQSVKDERRPNLNKASLLGWKPTVDIDEGLKRTIKWFKEGI